MWCLTNKVIVKMTRSVEDPDSKSYSFSMNGTTQTSWHGGRREMPQCSHSAVGLGTLSSWPCQSGQGWETPYTWPLGHCWLRMGTELASPACYLQCIWVTGICHQWLSRAATSADPPASGTACPRHPLALAHCKGQEICCCASGTSCCLSELSKVLS